MKPIVTIGICLAFATAAFSQCPYTTPPFNAKQVTQLCTVWSAQQQQISGLQQQTANLGSKVKVDMMTVQPGKQHHVGNIYAVLVGGSAPAPGMFNSGGVLVPILPPTSPATRQMANIGSASNATCTVALSYNSAQDYMVENACSFPIKIVAIYSGGPVTPLD